MKTISGITTPLDKARLAAAIELRGRSKGRGALHAYLAEMLKVSLVARFGEEHGVSIAYANGQIHCHITPPHAPKIQVSHPTLSDVIMIVNNRFFARPEDAHLRIDLCAAINDIEAIRQESAGAHAAEERSAGGIIIARR